MPQKLDPPKLTLVVTSEDVDEDEFCERCGEELLNCMCDEDDLEDEDDEDDEDDDDFDDPEPNED